MKHYNLVEIENHENSDDKKAKEVEVNNIMIELQ